MKSYSLYEAVGLHLFKMLSRTLSNDGYWAHVSFLPEGKKILLITLRYLIKLTCTFKQIFKTFEVKKKLRFQTSHISGKIPYKRTVGN